MLISPIFLPLVSEFASWTAAKLKRITRARIQEMALDTVSRRLRKSRGGAEIAALKLEAKKRYIVAPLLHQQSAGRTVQNNLKEHYGFALRLLCLVCSVLFTSGCPRIGTSPPEVSSGIGQLAEAKSKAEQSASTLKNYPSDTKVYKQGEALYVDAKAAFDGWIGQLKYALVASTDIEKSELYKESLNRAGKKSEAFVSYVRDLSFRPQGIEPIGIIGALFDGSIKVWKEYRDAQKEKRDEIIKLLDDLKWKDFKDINK